MSERNPTRPAAVDVERIPVDCWKVGYATEGEARWHARRAQREQLQPYRCHWCRTWHITNRASTLDHECWNQRVNYHHRVINKEKP